MSDRISVVIASMDEYDQTQKTIASIRETAGNKPEVVIVDDASQVPLTLLDKNCVLVRNEQRAGVGASRHSGVLKATGNFILITDAHVRFEAGWYEKTIAVIKDRPVTLHCGQCIGLEEGQMDMTKSNSFYHGAYMKFLGPDDNVKNQTQILECCWMPATNQDDFVMSGLMGACYAMPTDWYLHIGGLGLLKEYGSDEPLLAIKTWLAGGEVRMCKTLRIGHMFRTTTHYKNLRWKLIWNKIAVILTTMPPDRAWKLIYMMPNCKELTEAKQHIQDDWNVIESERAYNQSIFKRSFEWYISYFGLTCP